MKLIIEIPDEVLTLFKQYVKDGCANVAETIIANGTPLQDLYDLEGLKSDMKALNCGYPYGLDYLLNCLNNRLGITIIEADKEQT